MDNTGFESYLGEDVLGMEIPRHTITGCVLTNSSDASGFEVVRRAGRPVDRFAKALQRCQPEIRQRRRRSQNDSLDSRTQLGLGFGYAIKFSPLVQAAA